MSHESVPVGYPTAAVAPEQGGFPFSRLVTGLFVCVAGFLVWREFEPVLLFRPVDGVVVGAGVEKSYVYAKGRSTRYAPQIFYRYEVNGERFLSWQYRRTMLVGTRSAASDEARRFVIGNRVLAWYNPYHPAESVLSRKADLLLFLMLAVLGYGMWQFSVASEARRNGAAPHLRN